MQVSNERLRLCKGISVPFFAALERNCLLKSTTAPDFMPTSLGYQQLPSNEAPPHTLPPTPGQISIHVPSDRERDVTRRLTTLATCSAQDLERELEIQHLMSEREACMVVAAMRVSLCQITAIT